MRSRYAAYVVNNLDHLERTAAPEAREAFKREDAEQVADQTTWLGLDIRNVIDGGLDDQTGQIDFVFRYRLQGRKLMQHELADFRREDGVWLYEGSKMNPKSPPLRVEKINRNDPCICGSGKKYKKCCGA